MRCPIDYLRHQSARGPIRADRTARGLHTCVRLSRVGVSADGKPHMSLAVTVLCIANSVTLVSKACCRVAAVILEGDR